MSVPLNRRFMIKTSVNDIYFIHTKQDMEQLLLSFYSSMWTPVMHPSDRTVQIKSDTIIAVYEIIGTIPKDLWK